MSAPTPGPWRIDQYNRNTIRSGDLVVGPVICTCNGGDEEAAANLRLIAAAPDLLEACRAYLATSSPPWELRELMAAAIAKATGTVSS